MLLYALTIFCSAFLLFAVQPLIGKFLLPWFGGAPAVWTTCMFFFQALLLLGYSYSHLLCRNCSPKLQRTIHLTVLSASVMLMLLTQWCWKSPLLPGSNWKPLGNGEPIWRVIRLLTASVGLPFFILSTTGPLLQHWFSRTQAGRSPYRLYALSNLGSLLALLGYPVLMEPLLSLRVQAAGWALGYVAFALLAGSCALRMARVATSEFPDCELITAGEERHAFVQAPAWSEYVLWVSLSACASVLLLAITNQLCQEVAVVPFLWVLPLTLYLLSFILCFESNRAYRRGLYLPALGISLAVVLTVLYQGTSIRIPAQVFAYSLALFACCMVCHGELARLKPSPRYLTAFYLMIALGGALGGVLVGLVAPRLFNGYWELHLGLWFCCLLVLVVLLRDRTSWIYQRHPWPALAFLLLIIITAALNFYEDWMDYLPESWTEGLQLWGLKLVLGGVAAILVLGAAWRFQVRWKHPAVAIVCLSGGILVMGVLLYSRVQAYFEDSVWKCRNFYGVLVVLDEEKDVAVDRRLRLRHGRITHGLQFQEPTKRRIPTSYYGLNSGVGLALRLHPRRLAFDSQDGNLRIGVVGLGVGTIASYAQPGDYLRFYEINPEVIGLSLGKRGYFTYLKDCPGTVEVIPGDARLAMERELDQKTPQQFDLLAIDAFSSDSIPVHLLTREAMEVYLKHLRTPGGILALHITNRYLDLRPVVWHLADYFGLRSALIESDAIGDLAWESHWMLLSRDKAWLLRDEIARASTPRPDDNRRLRLWSDDYSNLLQVLKW